jgi:hypothetical protein
MPKASSRFRHRRAWGMSGGSSALPPLAMLCDKIRRPMPKELTPPVKKDGVSAHFPITFHSFNFAKVRLKTIYLLFLLLAPLNLPAQNVTSLEITAYAGRPLNKVVQSNIPSSAAPYFSQEIDSQSYLLGLSAGVTVRDRWRIEFGATYMPISFRTTAITGLPLPPPFLRTTTTPTHGTAWEMPASGVYRWMSGSIRPFSGGGLVVWNRTTTGVSQSPAPMVRGGIEWNHGRISIRPEFRYIHFPQKDTSTTWSLGRPATQTQILLGFAVRVK